MVSYSCPWGGNKDQNLNSSRSRLPCILEQLMQLIHQFKCTEITLYPVSVLPTKIRFYNLWNTCKLLFSIQTLHQKLISWDSKASTHKNEMKIVFDKQKRKMSVFMVCLPSTTSPLLSDPLKWEYCLTQPSAASQGFSSSLDTSYKDYFLWEI